MSVEGSPIPVPVHFRGTLSEDMNTNAVGTIIRVTESGSAPIYSFRLDDVYLDIEIRPFDIPLYTMENYGWAARGSIKGGEKEGEPFKLHTGYSQKYLYIDVSPMGAFVGYGDYLLDIETVPEGLSSKDSRSATASSAAITGR
jgi:hypothetical protein